MPASMSASLRRIAHRHTREGTTIKVVMTDGTEFKTRSTWGSAGDVLKLDIDPNTHPAWTGGPQRVLETGRVARFRNKFKDFNLG